MPEKAFTLIEVATFAGGLAFIANWLALFPWRRANGAHWTERARLLHPVLVAAGTISWTLPAIITIGMSLVWPEDSPPWVLVALAGGLGTMTANLALAHEVRPHIKWPDLLRGSLRTWLTQFASWFLLLGAIFLMPDEFGPDSFQLFAVFVVSIMLWNRFYKRWLSRKLSLRMPAPPRLQTIATETALRMQVKLRKVWVLRLSIAQAYADIRSKDLLFTERLLEILSDEEVAAICAHELGHLSESKSESRKRWLLTASLWPWIFIKPLVHTFGLPAYVGLILCTAGIQTLRLKMSRKMEVRADKIARDNVAESAVYARALLRIYEDNQVPAVTSRKDKTHPDLYDRMLAAGVTPDFPRPIASKRMAWHGRALSFIFWIMLGILIVRTAGEFDNLSSDAPGEMSSTANPEK